MTKSNNKDLNNKSNITNYNKELYNT